MPKDGLWFSKVNNGFGKVVSRQLFWSSYFGAFGAVILVHLGQLVWTIWGSRFGTFDAVILEYLGQSVWNIWGSYCGPFGAVIVDHLGQLVSKQLVWHSRVGALFLGPALLEHLVWRSWSATVVLKFQTFRILEQLWQTSSSNPIVLIKPFQTSCYQRSSTTAPNHLCHTNGAHQQCQTNCFQ